MPLSDLKKFGTDVWFTTAKIMRFCLITKFYGHFLSREMPFIDVFLLN